MKKYDIPAILAQEEALRSTILANLDKVNLASIADLADFDSFEDWLDCAGINELRDLAEASGLIEGMSADEAYESQRASICRQAHYAGLTYDRRFED